MWWWCKAFFGEEFLDIYTTFSKTLLNGMFYHRFDYFSVGIDPVLKRIPSTEHIVEALHNASTIEIGNRWDRLWSG